MSRAEHHCGLDWETCGMQHYCFECEQLLDVSERVQLPNGAYVHPHCAQRRRRER